MRSNCLYFCLQKIYDGVCDDSHNDAVDSDVVTIQRTAPGSCPYTCDQADSDEEEEEVCGSDGRTYVSLCQLQHQTCVSGSNLRMIHEGIKIETGAVKIRK